MTSAWKEPPGRDDRAEGQDSGPDENQLEMFDVTPRASAEMLLPPGSDFVYGSARHEGGGRGHFLDMGGADSDELRRLEDSCSTPKPCLLRSRRGAGEAWPAARQKFCW